MDRLIAYKGGKMAVSTVNRLEISDEQSRFILERGGIMTIYRAASVVG